MKYVNGQVTYQPQQIRPKKTASSQKTSENGKSKLGNAVMENQNLEMPLQAYSAV